MALKRLLLGTQNPGKIAEIRALLAGSREVVGLSDLAQPAPTVIEDETSYYEHALKKAVIYQRFANLPVLADDSGLEVDVLGGAPGVHSAYFGGEALTWPQRWAHLAEVLKPFPVETWVARFRCVLCYYDGKEAPVFFEGTAQGKILPVPQGSQGFGYDPVVFSDELGMSFAQAAPSDKNRVSHRAKALQSLREWLDRRDRRG